MSDDARDHVRIGKKLEFLYSCDGQQASARLEDLSEGGAFVDTQQPHSKGSVLKYSFTLPGDDEPIAGKAIVRWHQPTVGMGIEFLDLDADQRERIKFYVAAEFFKSFSE